MTATVINSNNLFFKKSPGKTDTVGRLLVPGEITRSCNDGGIDLASVPSVVLSLSLIKDLGVPPFARGANTAAA